jgi:hypothetical protein
VRIAADGRHEFPSGGWTIWRERGLLVTFDHGPLGLGSLAAHGHADALSVTLFRGRDGLVVDPGTLAYQEDAEARDRCRGTPAHATVNFGGRNQSEILGPFLWGRRAAVAPEGEGWRVVAYTGERHTRRVSVEGARLTIEDHVEGREPDAVFPLAPEARAEIEGDRVVVECGDSKATFEFEGFSPPRLETSEHSPRYSHRVAARRIVARLAGARGVTRITAGGR